MGLASFKGLNLVLLLATSLSACARGELSANQPTLNEPQTILPIAVSSHGSHSTAGEAQTSVTALLVKISVRDEALTDPDVTLHFHKSYKSRNPDLSIRWGDWLMSYQTSGCNREQLAVLDQSSAGVALVCDGRINLNAYQYVEAIDMQGNKWSATGWATRRLTEEVVAAEFAL